MNPTTTHTLNTAHRCAEFPWLDLTREERDNLDRLVDPDLDRLATSIARRAIDEEFATPLDQLLPTLPLTYDLESLDWPARHRNVLRRHQLATAADLGSITVAGLLATWSVSTGTTEAILARLFRTVLAHRPIGGRSGPRRTTVDLGL